MPTKREREYYRMGYADGIQDFAKDEDVARKYERGAYALTSPREQQRLRKPKRKLSAWNKFVKNKRNHIKYRDGKLNLKKMGVEFRKKKRRR